MTEVTTRFEQEPDAGPAQSAATVPSEPAPTLITEQQVLFGTAAAAALPPVKTRRFSDAVHAVVGSVRTWLVSAAQPPVPQRYPKRHVWLENSLMSREMHRL
jgi:hypothetical protein